MPDQLLSTTLCGIPLRNPVLAASGTFGYGIEFAKLVDLNQLGGLVTKGLSREPIAGNPAPRLWHTEGGMMNSIGLQNVGVAAFIRDKLPKLREYSVPVIANVFGYSTEDYVEVVRALEDAPGIAAYELNVSCPNTKEGGIFFSSDPVSLAGVVSRVRQLTKRPMIVKLSPNVARIEPFAGAAAESGADAISLVNTFVALAIDVTTRAPRIGNGFGGLSGPAIKPLALRLVYEAAKAVRVPVIGLGGILSGEDAAEFLIAGACAVEVGTASFVDPRAPQRIARQLGQILRRLKVNSVSELVGTLRMPGAKENTCKIEP
ncbi:MAG TPA: dihydroorotate dehydrogenase [Bryobacteraceae bacterium]|nr:dihydroorotate dehydrogenase [Bryobacteraceae bacterium]